MRKIKVFFIFFIFLLSFGFYQNAFAIEYLEITKPESFSNLDPGTKVLYKARVIVEPGVLGKRIFYLDGAEVYSHWQDFPVVDSGDLIEVKGELSFPFNYPRIKIKSKEDIAVIDKGDLSSVETIKLEKESFYPLQLVNVSGEVIEKQGDRVYLWVNENFGIVCEVKDSLGLNKELIKQGDFISGKGIVFPKDNEINVVLISFQKDLTKQGLEEQTITLPKYKESIRHYLFISLGCLLILFFSLIIFLN